MSRREASAQLTLKGKMHIEKKQKYIPSNYESISEDKNTIDLRIEGLKEDLQKLGFGQQIIFDELE